MTEPTEDELRLAREIADAKYHSGERPGSWRIARDAALAAIRETTERAARWIVYQKIDAERRCVAAEKGSLVERDHAVGVVVCERAVDALRNGEHLKGDQP